MRAWINLGLALAVLACVTEVELLAVVVALTCFPWPRARQHKALLLEAKTALLARHQGKAADIRTDLARTVPLSVFSFSFPLSLSLPSRRASSSKDSAPYHRCSVSLLNKALSLSLSLSLSQRELTMTSSHILLKTKFSKLLPFFIFSFFPTLFRSQKRCC